jgi:glycosyltransferase involved in cell wall biosynthesis
MKLALVHDWLTGMRGGEKCLEAIGRHFPQAELYTLLHVPGSTSATIESRPIHTSFLQRLPGAARHYRYLLPLMPRAVQRLKLPDDVDLVLSFSHAVAKAVRVPPGVPHVCYCFTPMRYAWHLRGEYFRQPGPQGPLGVFSGRIVRRPLAAARDAVLDRLRDWDRRTADRVTHFVAISRTVQARIAACYGRESHVIYPPVDTDFYTPADVPREDFYLCVSALVPYKRIDLAIDACRRLQRRLVIIGRGPQRAALERRARGDVEFLGWQSDEAIRDHLRRCRALLFPGLEDFGIVPLEAQACGAPVIAYGCGGATETVVPASAAQRGTGVLFPECTPESLAAAIRWLEDHPQQCCPKLARQQALRFSTPRYEQEMLGYLQRVVQSQHTTAALASP